MTMRLRPRKDREVRAGICSSGLSLHSVSEIDGFQSERSHGKIPAFHSGGGACSWSNYVKGAVEYAQLEIWCGDS
jgi:hypothetical protein